MSASTTVLASVFNDDGRCIGFVLARGLTGFEGFTTAEKSIGLYPSARQAANALLIKEGGV